MKNADKMVSKLNQEIKDFREDLLKLSKQEIINRAYEISYVNEVEFLINDNIDYLGQDEINYLLEQDKVLDALYNDFLGLDSESQAMCGQTISDQIARLNQ